MPTYKYRREDGTTFKIRQKITADALEECPETGQNVERVITGGMGFQLKGGGWYDDGYASAGASQEGTGNASQNGDASTNGTGDAKTADSNASGGDAANGAKTSAASGDSSKSNASTQNSDAS